MWLDETVINLKNIADEIGDVDARYKALSGIVIFYSKVGQVRRSEKSLEEAVRIAESIKTMDERAVAYRNIAVSIAKMKESLGAIEEMDSAFDMTLRIKTNFERSMALSEIGQVLSRMGDFDTAKKAINQASNLVPNINNAFQRSQALTEVVITTADLGAEKRKTDLIFIAINLSRDIMGGFNRLRANIKIAESFAMLDESRRALDFISKAYSNLKHITEAYNKAKAMGNLSSGLSKVMEYVNVPPQYGTPTHLLAQAETIADNVMDKYFQVVAYRALTDAHIDLRDPERSWQSMRKTIDATTKINDSYNRSLAFAHLAYPFVMLGELLKAKRSIEHAVYHMRRLRNDSFKSASLKNISESLAEFIGTYDTVAHYLNKVDTIIKDGRMKGADMVEADIMLRKARYALKDNMSEWAINLAIEANDKADASMGRFTDIIVGGRQEVDSEEPLPTGLMRPIHKPMEVFEPPKPVEVIEAPRGTVGSFISTPEYEPDPLRVRMDISHEESAKRIAAGDKPEWEGRARNEDEPEGERPFRQLKKLKVREDLGEPPSSFKMPPGEERPIKQRPLPPPRPGYAGKAVPEAVDEAPAADPKDGTTGVTDMQEGTPEDGKVADQDGRKKGQDGLDGLLSKLRKIDL